jgi:hypothetical protein
MTLRQLHCAIFSAAKIPYANTKEDFNGLGYATSNARKSYRNLHLMGRPICSIRTC